MDVQQFGQQWVFSGALLVMTVRQELKHAGYKVEAPSTGLVPGPLRDLSRRSLSRLRSGGLA